jgi:hypothetical protein
MLAEITPDRLQFFLGLLSSGFTLCVRDPQRLDLFVKLGFDHVIYLQSHVDRLLNRGFLGSLDHNFLHGN